MKPLLRSLPVLVGLFCVLLALIGVGSLAAQVDNPGPEAPAPAGSIEVTVLATATPGAPLAQPETSLRTDQVTVPPDRRTSDPVAATEIRDQVVMTIGEALPIADAVKPLPGTVYPGQEKLTPRDDQMPLLNSLDEKANPAPLDGIPIQPPSAEWSEGRGLPGEGLPETLANPSAVGGWTTIKYENFEGAWPNGSWRSFDNDGATNGQYFWDDDDYKPRAGYWSGWPANGGTNAIDPQYYYYANNMRSWMVYGPFDLSNSIDAEMLFYYWNQSELGFDHFSWLASANGTNFYGTRVSGDSGGWRFVNFDLTAVPTLGNLVGDSSVWIAMVFNSDGSIVDDGPFVDDVTIQKNASLSCPGQYRAEYFNNRTLTGSPTYTRCEGWPIYRQWNSGGPGNGVGSDNFSARWTGRANFTAGNYTFKAVADDGVRVWLDSTLIINGWINQPPTEYKTTRYVSGGEHAIKVEYYEAGGGATAQFRWDVASLCPSITRWKGEYWNNQGLSGNPVHCRDDANVDFDWSYGSPNATVPVDHFSARWTRSLYFNSGRYRFHLKGDDGIRLYVDGNRVIDKWIDQGFTEYTAELNLSTGNHSVVVEYYENGGAAAVKLWWEVVSTSAVVVSNRAAFDACVLPKTGDMQTWWNTSPYREINLYIGGANRGCNAHNQTYLTAAWVSTVRAQGWNFIPTWVGPQAPCSGYGSRMSYDLTTAYNQGRAEADAAANAAKNLGLTTNGGLGGTIIYYDLEGHTGGTACREAVKSFINGWTGRLRELGNRAGGYGSSCASYLADWSTIANVPNDMWIANYIRSSYDPNVTVWNTSCIDNGLWSNHQRIRQYTNGHSESYGGVTLSIDSDIADGHVAGTNPRSAIQGQELELASDNNIIEPPVEAMQLLNAREGWVLRANHLLWTVDAGLTWRDVTPPVITGGWTIRGATFIGSRYGWVLAGTPSDSEGRSEIYLARTTDGMTTWKLSRLPFEPVDPNSTQNLGQLQFVDGRTGWVVIQLASGSSFSHGVLFRTYNGGRTWAEYPLPVGGRIWFANRNRGWLAGGVAGDELYMTRNGGRTWTRQEFPADTGRDRVTFVSLPQITSNGHVVVPVTVADPSNPRVEFYLESGNDHLRQLLDTVPLTSVPSVSSHTTFLPDGRVLLVEPNGNVSVQRLERTNGARAPQSGQTPLPGAVEVQFANNEIGWTRVSYGVCSGEKLSEIPGTFHCSLVQGLWSTSNGGLSWVEVQLP